MGMIFAPTNARGVSCADAWMLAAKAQPITIRNGCFKFDPP
jgi:hypothetical protein